MNTGEIIIYQGPDGGPQINVQLDQETLWLTQSQMAELFGKDSDTVGLHIRNIFQEHELEEAATTEEFSVVRTEGNRQVTRRIRHYDLDVIIAVGYRVNSKRGTQFRQWANQVLKDYLVKGYALNQQRLEGKLEQAAGYLKMLVEPLSQGALSASEQQGFVELIERYSKTMVLLNRFDEGRLSEDGSKEPEYRLRTEDCLEMVALLKADLIQKQEASELFGNQKDDSFDGVIGAVNQTVFGEEAYPTVEAKAAHLLYFVIKNHPFSDGNKRIGAFLFAWYLERNRYHLHRGTELKINENALAAIALLVALSDPKDKDMLLRLIMGLVG